MLGKVQFSTSKDREACSRVRSTRIRQLVIGARKLEQRSQSCGPKTLREGCISRSTSIDQVCKLSSEAVLARNSKQHGQPLSSLSLMSFPDQCIPIRRRVLDYPKSKLQFFASTLISQHESSYSRSQTPL